MTASCPECQPHADEHNRIAGQINALNRELAFRRREVDLQQQAVDLVASEIAGLEQLPQSAERDARLKFARERLEAYRAQLVRELAKVAALERQLAELGAQLAAAKGRLRTCEKACGQAGEPQQDPPPPETPPEEPWDLNIPEEIAGDADKVYEHLKQLEQTGPYQEYLANLWDLEDLDPEVGTAVQSRLDADEARTQQEINDRNRREQLEAEQFEASLKSMAGDVWAAQFAAFFTSTLFDPDTPFETAYDDNRKTLRQLQELTPEQKAALSKSALQNVTVAAERAQRLREDIAATGKQIEYGYTREARGLLGPNPDLSPAPDVPKSAALMTQDGHMGQLLQFRAGLNTIKIGDGTVTPGSLVTQSGAQSFVRLSQINQEIGTLRATGGDADRIAALEAERTTLLKIDGLAPSEGLMNARAGLIDGLADLSVDVYWAYWTWIEFQEQMRIIEFKDGVEVRTNFKGTPEQFEIEKKKYEARYLSALSQSPFLGAQVDPTGSGDSQTMWEYLTSGTRTPASDQAALTQAIDVVDQANAQVIDRFGTIVTTGPLLEAYGSPVFAPLRAQIITQLTPVYPQIAVYMGDLTGLYDANFAATEHTRVLTDVAIGFAQIGVGILIAGSIVFFPPATPALVTLEVTLTTGQVVLEGIRTYYAWQDLQRAEGAASAGAGASHLGTMPYRDLFGAQLSTFILVGTTAPISYAGSAMSLHVAAARVQAAEIAAFRALSAKDQVNFIRALPENVRGQYVSQLNRAESTAFTLAWEIEAESAKIVASVREGKLWIELLDNGQWGPVSEATRNAPAEVILDRMAPGKAFENQIRLSPDANQKLFAEEVGEDLIGPFSDKPPIHLHEDGGEGSHPAPGYYTADMSQAEIDALLAKPGPLTPTETVQKADLLLRGFGNPAEVVPGWTAPVQPTSPPPPWIANPFGIDLGPGTRGASDSSVRDVTEVIPGRIADPNRTAVLEAPDLPSETLILEPFTPPAAGLLDFPFDLNRLLQGDPLPIHIWTTNTPHSLRVRQPAPFPEMPESAVQAAREARDARQASLADSSGDTTVVGGPRVGTIIHVVPEASGAAVTGLPSPWLPFVIKMFPIGCQYTAGEPPACDTPTNVFVLQYPLSSSGTIVDALQQTPGFVYAEGDVLRGVQAADPYLTSRGSWGQPHDDQWALKQVGLPAPAAPARTGEPIVVAVIDTGVAWNHVDLAPNQLWINPREVPANGKDDDRNGYTDDIVGWNFVDRNNLPWDFNGHGTMVAGIIAAGRDNGAGIAGVNPGARIMALKAMDEWGRGNASAIAEAIVYAASSGARVINLSVGGRMLTRTEYLAIEFAWSRGALVVVAAGNEGIDLSDYGPGGLPRALTVTATDTSDRRVKESNYGPDIDLAAPGVDVLGPRAIGTDLVAAARARNYLRGENVVGGDAGYIRASGTSFAAPLVAGAASLLLAANPSLSAAQVERMLLHSARDIETPGVDHLTGYGRLDVAAALRADPAFFLDAAIARVEVANAARGPVARVIGTADAEQFAGARIEIGAGESPSAWKPVEGGPARPVRNGVLAEIPAAAFQGSGVWTLRIVASHANGRTREARYLLRLN
ncbi:MAG TPA: S8 family serine peptidase [Steroidobacteraceae bacterium]